MKIVLIISLLFFSNASFAQQATPAPPPHAEPPPIVTKVIRIRYGNASKIAELISRGTSANVTADNVLSVIVLRGAPNSVASLEQTIHELDTPGTGQAVRAHRDVELIVSVLGASDKTELLSQGQISEALTPVVKQLRAVFPYRNYQLLSSMLLRSSEGTPGGNTGVIKNMANSGNLPQMSGYGVGFEQIIVSSEEDKPRIRIRNFSFKTSVPTLAGSIPNTTQWQDRDVLIRTDVDLREGQKVVVGKADVGSSDLALFVVLTARLVE
jgi:hypothetical protein